jgi:hypothetical protein
MGRALKNWRKYAPSTFVENAENMSSEELKNAILESSEMIKRTDDERDEDMKLAELQETLKDLKDAYNDTLRAYKAKILGALEILEERGVPVVQNQEH